MIELSLKPEIFFNILNNIFSTLNINEILTRVVDDIQAIIGADRCTLYLINTEREELFSKVLQADNLVEIRVPIKKDSLSGYSYLSGKVINIKDAYDCAELSSIDSELCFDKSWDEKSGYRTKSVMIVPITLTGRIIGIFQALNKPGGFSEIDINIMKQLSFLLSIAINNALLYQTIEEEKNIRKYIMDDAEEGICILDTKKRILSANKFLEVMSGMRYSVEAMTGKNFFDIFPNFVDTQLEEKVNEAISLGFKMKARLEVLDVKITPYIEEKSWVEKLILIFTRI